MSHHGSQPFNFSKINIEELFQENNLNKELMKNLPIPQKFDPTKQDEVSGYFKEGEYRQPEQEENKFPHGKLTESDQGTFQYGLSVANDVFVIQFNKPVHWVGFTKKEVEQLIYFMQSKLSEL